MSHISRSNDHAVPAFDFSLSSAADLSLENAVLIRSMRVILCRTLLGVLDSRRVNIFAVSEATRIPIPELRRLVEFASPLDRDSAERLVSLGDENGDRHEAKNTRVLRPGHPNPPQREHVRLKRGKPLRNHSQQREAVAAECWRRTNSCRGSDGR